MRLVWSAEARQLLSEIRLFIAQDNPSAARATVAAIRATAELLLEYPEAGRAEAELGSRRLPVPRTPYRLHSEVRQDRIVILTVWHGARQWPPASS
ncbi:type II toxin-antitoxin system RelE/ParE family toxin [Falsiroseomonas oryziterrae]|uniref:type II toxin-antitoxin system RelE/ParE family toxin n=1 Tax=Falsiroseomonas oryziterrae TaxID=2911368 RepID=UPI001F375E05|nr:type II toxin-antitoxin system RelE/ParE family toxin [Roseomonas sp. NPKOSM-4]